LKVIIFCRLAALLFVSTLAACGGGDDETPPAVAQVVAVKPVLQVQIKSFDCQDQGKALIIGEEGRPVKCFFVFSDSEATLTGIDVSMMGLITRQLSSVSLLASTDKGWQDLSGKVSFGADSKLTLRVALKLSRAPTVLRIVTDAPYLFDSVEGSVALTFGAVQVEYDKQAYSGIKIVGDLGPEAFVVKHPAGLVISSDMVSGDFYPSSLRYVLMLGVMTNPSSSHILIESGSLFAGSNFDSADLWIKSCMSGMRVSYYASTYSYSVEPFEVSVSSFNQFNAGMKLSPGESVTVEVTVDTNSCSGPFFGVNLSTYLNLQYRYLDLLRPQSSTFEQMGVIRLP
jgi:hypothetical protein